MICIEYSLKTAREPIQCKTDAYMYDWLPIKANSTIAFG